MATLGFDLHVRSCNSATDWDVAKDILIKEGKLKPFSTFDYFEEYKKTLRYWDGETWTTTPTLNKRWLEAVKKMK